MFRRRRKEPEPELGIDPAALDARWRTPVQDALGSRQRFREVLSRSSGGPFRARLEELSQRVDEIVLATWQAASNAQAAERALAGMDPLSITDRLKQVRRDLEIAETRGSEQADALRRRVDELSAQHRSAHRVLNSLEQTEEQLRLLDLRLDAAVLQVVDLVLLPAGEGSGEQIESDVSRLVEEMDSLRSAVDEVAGLGRPD